MINFVVDKFIAIENRFAATPYIYTLLGNCCIAVMQTVAKLLHGTLSPMFVLYLRATLLMVINTFVMTSMGQTGNIKKFQAFKLVLLRSCIATVGLIFNFTSLNYMSLSVINAIWMTGPIWTNFIQAAILGTSIRKSNIIVALLCLFGLTLITKPGFNQKDKVHNSSSVFYSLLVLAGAVCTSFSFVITRKVRNEVNNTQNLQHFYFVQTIINTLFMVSQYPQASQVSNFSMYSALLILILTVVGYLAQLMIIRSLYLKSASDVGLFSYSLIVASLLIDIFIFNQKLDWMSFLGVGIICSSLLVVLIK